MYNVLIGIFIIIFDIYWLIDGGAKYLGGQAVLLTILGVIVGGSFIVSGFKQMNEEKKE